MPFLGALRDDPVRILMPGGAETAVAVHGGFVEVSNDHVVVLSDLAELKEQIDVPRAEAAKRGAEEILARDPENADAARRAGPGRDPHQGRRAAPDLGCSHPVTTPARDASGPAAARRVRRGHGAGVPRAHGPVGVGRGGATAADVDPYRGLGAWVDSFDYAPRLQSNGNPPPVTASSVDDMARLGVRTLYLQVANPDGVSPDQLTDETQLREILTRARTAGLKVVAWYLPGLADVAPTPHGQDHRRVPERHREFDTVALDLEYTQGESDVAVRNDNTVEVARNTRQVARYEARARRRSSIPAVQTEVLNPVLWPNFPYKRLAESVDVWMPMTYYTFRSDPYRDPFRYTDESVTRLRKRLDNDNALVHPIGGSRDQTSPEDYVAFLRAVKSTKAIGYSVYDFNTTSSSAWTFLRGASVPG